ncbi:hypothetical protein B0H16DRAFT_1888391 [Mycena metata]|uniref:Uncharacterized protein n=1 Tax=Mycena metata TaxID=1033252 RepID=A0AAD7N883_9AGAR|nr:hypothetical protein B0H16DRAFT_1888391 [Mycena metata]
MHDFSPNSNFMPQLLPQLWDKLWSKLRRKLGVKKAIVKHPNLHTLRIKGYSLAPGRLIDFDSLRLNALRCLQLRNSFLDETDHSQWIPLLDADKMGELELVLNPPNGLDLDLLPSFPRVEHLTAYSSLSKPPQNFRILSKFPALRSLAIGETATWDMHWDGSSLQLAESELPLSLTKYTGSFAALHLLLPLPNLTSLAVSECDPFEFIKAVGIRAPKITTLSVCFMYFGPALFDDLCAIFSNWDVEEWDLTEYDWKVPELLETLVKSLPRRITQIAVHWNMDFESIGGLPPFQKFSDIIMKKHRSLNALWLGMTGKIGVKADLARRPDPHCELDEAKHIHKDFESSWEVLGAAM